LKPLPRPVPASAFTQGEERARSPLPDGRFRRAS
jgi:hypothetical protein